MTQVTIINSNATTVCKAGAGVLRNVNICKAGSTDCAIDIYDNASAGSGRKMFSGGGATTGSFACDQETGVIATAGITVVTSGTTAPILNIYWT